MLAYFFAKIIQTRAALASRLSAFGVGPVAQIVAGFVIALSAVPLIATSHSWFALPLLLSGLLLSAVGRVNASARIEALWTAGERRLSTLARRTLDVDTDVEARLWNVNAPADVVEAERRLLSLH